MKKMALLFCSFIILTSISNAEENNCKSFTESWEASEKTVALLEAQNSTENSAIRVTMRSSQVQAEISKASQVFEQMKSAKCPLPKGPFNTKKWEYNSLVCSTCLFLGNACKEDCDITKWSPMQN